MTDLQKGKKYEYCAMLIAENTVISMRRNIEQPKLSYILGKEGLSEQTELKKIRSGNSLKNTEQHCHIHIVKGQG
jgi:hypothetical protein